MGLAEYKKKRHFSETPEPSGSRPKSSRHKASGGAQQFIIQKHAASHLHYDFRLEMDGVLKSWAVPKGPSLDPQVRALAVHVEDHPIEYGTFEGTIPKNQYGGGTVMLWDRGTWDPEGNPKEGYRRGKLTFALHGEKLSGRWTLIRMHGSAGGGGRNWLLKKVDDDKARPAAKLNVLEKFPRSVATGRSMDEIAGAKDRVWNSNRPEDAKNATKGRKSSKPSAVKISPSLVAGAVKEPQPKSFTPQMATLVDTVPESDEWLHELKFDGYRLLCMLRNGKPRLVTRRGNDWTDRFPTVAKAASELKIKEGILDGEVVVLTADGKTDFQALQNSMQREREDDLVYYVFDLPFIAGFNLCEVPLIERKKLLKQVLRGSSGKGLIRYSDHIVGSGDAAFTDACKRGLEGLICKRIDSTYQQRRTEDWVKVKCKQRQEFVLGGWSEPEGSRVGFRSLLLGYYDEQKRFIYCGRVGTGFSNDSLKQIKKSLLSLEQEESAFDEPPRGAEARGVRWVKPKIVVEIEFAEWTSDGRLRSPSFQGIREDKGVHEVVREKPSRDASVKSARPALKKTSPKKGATARQKRPAKKASRVGKSDESDSNRPAGVRLSNPDRVLFPDQGLTKSDLANYYVQVADWVLPHLVHRPLTLVRCPQGQSKPCFYQKHLADSLPAPVRGINVEEKGGVELFVAIDDLPGLITLVQMSALEIHPWGSQEDKLDYPDRMIIDLDPAPDVPWKEVVKGAFEVKEILSALGLESFVRTTGGKGVHVIAPLVRRANWDVVKDLAHSIANFLARNAPNRYVATSSKAKRKGKIYADYLRNDRGATAVASYSTRARNGAPVATPLRWDELTPELNPLDLNIKTVPARLRKLRKDPWEGFFKPKQSVSADMARQINQT